MKRKTFYAELEPGMLDMYRLYPEGHYTETCGYGTQAQLEERSRIHDFDIVFIYRRVYK